MTTTTVKDDARAADRQKVSRSARSWRLRTRLEPYLLLLPAMALLALIYVWPTVYNVLLSFQKVTLIGLANGTGRLTGLDNYTSLLSDERTYSALFNTVVILTAATVVLRIVLGLGLAALLNAAALRRFRLTGVARSLLLLPWVLPPVVAIAVFRWLLHPRYGVINQTLLQLGLVEEPISFLSDPSWVWPTIIAVVLWNELPFATLMFIAGMQGIPADVYEAAQIDGATRWQSFRYVTLPLLRPVVVVVGLLTTIWTYNNFIYVWLTTRGGPGEQTQVLATRLYTEGFLEFQVGRASALGVLMSLLMAALAVLYYRYVFRPNLSGGR